MLEGYITPLLMSYINKYVNNIKPSDLKVSFWGGDAVLRNLELRLDVLKKELHVPLEFRSGFIRELVIHLPWSSIASTSVEVTIKDLELVIQLRAPSKAVPDEESSEDGEKDATGGELSNTDLSPVGDLPQSKAGMKEEAPPGYLHGYMNRILNNIHVQVQNMVVKVLEEESDLMLTLNIGSIEFFTANKNWQREFIYTDYFQSGYTLNKVCEVKDIGVNLHPIEIGEKAQGSFLHEAFIKRSSFTCRVKSEYGKKILVRKSFEVLIENLEFSVDEKQFCLFLHLLDRLLAMYYNSKRLKGRDDVECTSVVERREAEGKQDFIPVEKSGTDIDMMMVDPFSEASAVNAGLTKSGSTLSKSSSETTSSSQGSSAGWGSWLWSVVGASEEEKLEGKMDSKEELETAESPGGERSREARGVEIKEKASELANFHFSILAKSVTVTLKMTQQVQVPVFLSLRSFTTPVIVVQFAGCMATVDRCPIARSFVVSVGIKAVVGEVLGFCPCVKKYPSSWRRTSATASSDSSKAIKVFSMGTDAVATSPVAKEDDTAMESSDIEEDHENRDSELLKYSLFAGQDTVDYPLEIDKTFLDDLGRPFKAVWFTYDYRDVGPSTPVEECTETLQVGVVNADISPDVVHRLELYLLSFKNSLEATPLVSKGMVVLGDPKAVTFLSMYLSGIVVNLTSATHYLPVMTTPIHKSKTPPVTSKHGKKSKKKPTTALLPGLHVSVGESKMEVSMPMYGGNATVEVPQKMQVKGNLCDITTETLSMLSLGDGLKTLEKRDVSGQSSHILKIPQVKCIHHGSRHGDLADSEDTRYSKILISNSLIELSAQQISKAVFVLGSWRKVELGSFFTGLSPCVPALKYQPPLVSKRSQRLSHVTLSITGVEVSASHSSKFMSYAASINSAYLCAAEDGSRGGIVPVLHGPLETSRFGKAETCLQKEQSPIVKDCNMDAPGKKLVEALITYPQGDHKEAAFSTMQCCISGVCLNLEPSILECLKLLIVHSLTVTSTVKSGEELAASPLAASPLAGGGKAANRAEGFGLPFTFTPSTFPSDMDVGNDREEVLERQAVEQHGLIALLKSFAVKVMVDPIIFIFPTSNSPLTDLRNSDENDSEKSSSHLHKFPIFLDIIILRRSALVVSSPQVVLESAKSHVLDEPVPKLGRQDTLPWDCSLTDACVFTTSAGCLRYLLEPVTVKGTLAAQQEGLAVTIHSETVTLAMSRKQVEMVKMIMADVSAKISVVRTSIAVSSQTPNLESEGKVAPKSGNTHSMALPTASSATPSSFRTLSDISTTSSYQGVSSLWLQLLVSKCVLRIYGKEHVGTSLSVGEEGLKVTSPTIATMPVMVSVEADSLSLQVDVQEKCTDFIFKMASLESHLSVFGITSKSWEPYHTHSRGNLFSSTISNLPDDILQVTAPGFSLNQFQSPGIGRTTDVYSTCFSPNFSSSFIYLKGYIPLRYPRVPKFEMNIRPFELVVWLPLTGLLTSVFSSEVEMNKSSSSSLSCPPTPPPSTEQTSSTWPSLQLSVDCFRVIFPGRDLLHASLLLTSAGFKVSSAVDFAGPEVRHVVNQKGYQKLALLSAERKRSPLPAYQCDVYSVAIWGIGGRTMKRAFLYLSNTDLQLTYTPPLYSAPPGRHMQEPPNVSPVVCGHCLEIILTNNCCLFSGKEQITNLMNILTTNNLDSNTSHSSPAVHKQHISKHTNSSGHSDQSSSLAQPTTPFKILITGKTVTAVLYSCDGKTTADGCSGCDSYDVGVAIGTVLQLSFYNPMLSLQNSEERDLVKEDWRTKTSGEISIFDISIRYSKDISALVYTDWIDSTNIPSVSSLVFSSKSGLIKEGSNLPPNLLGLIFSFGPSNESKSTQTTKYLELKVERSCKLICSPGLLEGILDMVVEVSEEVKSYKMKEEGNIVDDSLKKKDVPHFSLPDIQFSTGQFLLEFRCGLEEYKNAPWFDQMSPTPEEDEESSIPATKEGILLSWDSLSVCSKSAVGSSGNAARVPKVDGSVKLCGLQLLSFFNGCSEFILPPTMLQGTLVQHQPNSDLDQSYFLFILSTGLVDILLSQPSVMTLLKTVQILTACTRSGPRKGNHVNSDVNKGNNDRSQVVARSVGNVQHFKDDLRLLPFKYIIEDSESLVLPSAGEIVFYNGSHSREPPAMFWHYWEPRAITRLQVSPIPLVVSDENVISNPDVKVECSLEYWDDFTSAFVSVGDFAVGQSTSASIDEFSERPCSRLWRVALRHLIGWDDEETEPESHHVGHFTNAEGKLLPLSTILPPLSLAASTVVDSLFSPSFLPTLSIDLRLVKIRLNVFHRRNSMENLCGSTYEGFCIDEAAMNRIYPRTLELMTFTASELKFKMIRMKEDTHMVLHWSLELKYVDFYDLVWCTALHPVEISLSIDIHQGHGAMEVCKNANCEGDSSVNVTLKAGPSVLKVSQGLYHTISLVLHAWKKVFSFWNDANESQKLEEDLGTIKTSRKVEGIRVPATLLPGYFIICNDTDQDLLIGQDMTEEAVLLQKSCCMCYSWYCPASAPHKLHVAHGMESEERPNWTASFFPSETPSVQVLQIPLRLPVLQGTGCLYVTVFGKGGMQKQVVLSGNWKFFSALHVPIDLRLGTTNEDGSFDKHGSVKTLPPGGELPSILAPEGAIEGINIKLSDNEYWSSLHPLPIGGAGSWNKPNMLMELPDQKGGKLQFWFNTKPMVMSSKVCSHKITFSPLFAIKNCLPLELEVSIVHANLQGSMDSALALTSTCPGNGHTHPLPSLKADKWYWIKLRNKNMSLSEPPISLSTFLLHHLPFTSSKEASSSGSPPSSSVISLPLESCKTRSCKVHAMLVRSELNTITVTLRPEWVFMNQTTLPLFLMEPTADIDDVERKDIRCPSSTSQILCQDEFVLKVVYDDKPLVSNLVKCPPVEFADGYNEEKTDTSMEEQLACMPLYLNTIVPLGQEDRDHKDGSTCGEAMVSFKKQGSLFVAAVGPAFILHNSTTYNINLEAFIMQQGQSCDHTASNAGMLQTLGPGSTVPIIYWSVRGSFTPTVNTSLTHTLRFCASGSDSVTASDSTLWSIHLSTDFVRRSFSLPIMEDLKWNMAPCLLTMHEKNGVTYLVLQKDTNPQVMFCNLLNINFQAVEAQATGIDSCPQYLPARLQVAYQPPSIAKLYPMVYDGEIATEKNKRMVHSARNVQVKVRKTSQVGEMFGWSEPFSLVEGNKVFSVPEAGDVYLTVKHDVYGFKLTICPTSDDLTHRAINEVNVDCQKVSISRSVRFSINLSYLTCSLLNDTLSIKRGTETLRAIVTDFLCIYSATHGNTKVDLTAYSLKIENRAGYCTGEFDVCLLPRSEHAAPSQLFHHDFPPLIKILVHYNVERKWAINSFYFRLEPLTVQLEDSLLKELKRILESFKSSELFKVTEESTDEMEIDCIPIYILQEAERDLHPVTITSFMVEPIAIYLSARITLKAFLSCNDTPLHFRRYELESIQSNWSEISRVVAARYVSALFMHVGWVLGSLELIGSPVSFLQSVSKGIRDLVVLPYEGMTRSPGMFVLGIGHGTASFFRQISSGALTSVTSLAQSVSRNMERLSMDQDHITYQEQMRQQRPATHFSSAVATGFSSFGLSLMSAVAGLVEQPMQSVQSMDEADGTAAALLKGVGKGLLGVVTKPVGGAMELISKTGQGILCGTGLGQKIQHSRVPDSLADCLADPAVKLVYRTNSVYLRKHGETNVFLFHWSASKTGSADKFDLVLTATNLLIFEAHSSIAFAKINITDCDLELSPTLDMENQQEAQVELHIVNSRCMHELSDYPERKLEDVEIGEKYFHSVKPEDVCQPETILLVEDSTDSEEDMKEKSSQHVTKESDQGDSSDQSLVKRRSDEAFLMEECEAIQFCTVYHELKQSSTISDHFCLVQLF